MEKLLFTLICSLSLFSFSSFSMTIEEMGRMMDPNISQEEKDNIMKQANERDKKNQQQMESTLRKMDDKWKEVNKEWDKELGL